MTITKDILGEVLKEALTSVMGEDGEEDIHNNYVFQDGNNYIFQDSDNFIFN